MIEITKYDSNNGARRCNVCYVGKVSNSTLHVVTVGNEHGGFEMVLCNKCLSELDSKIGQYMKDYNQECENAGNNIELNQKRMLRFQNAISNAKTFIKD